MRVTVRIKRGDNSLHELIGDVAEPSDFAKIVHQAIDDFRTLAPDAPLWGLTISVDKYGR